MKEVIDDVLNFLFENFLNNPTESFEINPICKKHKTEPVSLSDQLRESGLIERPIVSLWDVVKCRIAFKGIIAIRPAYIAAYEIKTIEKLAFMKGEGDLVYLLGLQFYYLAFVRELAKKLEGDGLLTVIPISNSAIYARLTEKGWALAKA